MSLCSETAIIILNWNQPELTSSCLEALSDLGQQGCLIIVVDNGSTDNSAQTIGERFREVQLIETNSNLGYAAGNNIGIRYALSCGAKYICVLNNDVIGEAEFLEKLLEPLAANPNVGVVTPLIADGSSPHNTWTLGARIDTRTGLAERLNAGEPIEDLVGRSPFEVDAVSGAAMMFKSEVIERAGFMDEDYFFYFEETDWSQRIRGAGYQILAVPSSVVVHHASSTIGKASPAVDYYMTRNHLRFIYRNWSGMLRLLLILRTFLRTLRVMVAYTLKPHGGRRIPHRNARIYGVRDAARGRWGTMGRDVEEACGGVGMALT